MPNLTIPSFLLLALFLYCAPQAGAQCGTLDDAIPGITLTASGSGTNNRSGMVYNPLAELYYSVNAGAASYPADTYSKTGTLLASPAQGFDYRGAWWNPALNTFEGNGFSASGIFIQTLEAGTSFPTGAGVAIFTANQPNAQSIGDLDYDDNEIIYYDNGFIHRYSRNTNQFLGQYLVTDLPVALGDINSNSVVYTGCPGHEIGLYDFTNRRVLFVDKSTGKYSGASQLPGSAPQRNSFGMSYANNLFWLFNSGTWFSYQVVDLNASIANKTLDIDISLYPNPVADRLHIVVETAELPIQAELSTLQGQRLQLMPVGPSGEADLDMSALPSGIYVVKFISEKGIAARKVVKGN
jgi:hypothetical protein